MSDLIEKGLYFSLGLWSLTKERAEKAVQELVEKGKISKDEGAKIVKNLLTRAEQEKEAILKRIDSALDNSMKKLNLATRKEVERINKKLDAILDILQKQEKE